MNRILAPLAALCTLWLAPLALAGPISSYPSASTPYNVGDAVIGTQSGVTKQFTVQNIADVLLQTPNTGSLNITGLGGLNLLFNTTQSVSGTTSVNCPGSAGSILYPCANQIRITADTADATSPTAAFDEFQIQADISGSTMKGARQIFDAVGHFVAPSNAANPNPGYSAGAEEIIADSNDNGTGTTLLAGRGSFFGNNPVVVANSGATNLFGIVAEEADAHCNSCSVAIRGGVSSVSFGATEGSVYDFAFHCGATGGATGWHNCLDLSNVNGGAPLDSTGCVICVVDANANGIATGFDFKNYTFSGNVLNFTLGAWKGTGDLGVGTNAPNANAGYSTLTLRNATNGGRIDFNLGATLEGDIFNSTNSLVYNATNHIFQIGGVSTVTLTAGALIPSTALAAVDGTVSNPWASTASRGYIGAGVTPTLSGTCTTSTQVGGNTVGTFHATCTAQTVIITFAVTAPTGWICMATDITTTADTLRQSNTAASASSCTLSGTTAAADVIGFTAMAY